MVLQKYQKEETWLLTFKLALTFSYFFLSTRAGGLGINLTAADTVSDLLLKIYLLLCTYLQGIAKSI